MAEKNNHPLAQWRDRNHVTQKALASKLGVASLTVWRWEKGERKPRPSQAKAISDHTGIPITELRPDFFDEAIEGAVQ